MQYSAPLFPGHATGPRDLSPIIEVAPSPATRETLKKGGASMPGALTNYWQWREAYFDSGLERTILLVQSTRPVVRDVLDQPDAFSFVALNGKIQSHTPDLLIVYRNGYREFGVVKPFMKALALNLFAEVRNMAGQIPRNRADAIRVFTEFSVEAPQLDAAQLFNMALRRGDDRAADAVVQHLRRNGPLSIADLCAALGNKPSIYWSTLWLLARHRLVRDETTFITMNAIVAVPTTH